MHRIGISVTAAFVLSMIPLAPAALATPLSPPTAIANGGGGLLVDAGYYKRRHYKRGYSGFGFYWYGGRKYYPRKVYRHGKRYKYGYRKRGYRGYGSCVRVGDVRVCFR